MPLLFTSFPAIVAGFVRVFAITKPGTVNLPLLFSSFPATSTKLSKTFLHSDFFTELFASNAATSSVLDMAPAAFMPFIFGAIAHRRQKATSEKVSYDGLSQDEGHEGRRCHVQDGAGWGVSGSAAP